MMIGSLCLTEILKSWKSCSSNRLASQTALSTSASGVALPYFCSRLGSSEPALTPMRMLTRRQPSPPPRSRRPGRRTCGCCPGSRARRRRRRRWPRTRSCGWKWMSAITGIWLFVAMICSASASSWCGTATRTMSQPVAVSSAICCRVALMLVVCVVVIDCTLTWASPPTPTLPTWIWRVLRRGARVSGLWAFRD